MDDAIESYGWLELAKSTEGFLELLQPRGNALESKPMHHWMPGLLHPLIPVIVSVKTNEAVLGGARAASVMTMTKKKTM